jgi:phosphate transport system substrate-binding protein
MQLNKHVSLYTEGGGSATGFQALIDGKVDICAASRTMRAYEVRLLAEKQNKLGVAHLVAKDALSVYLNPANPITTLTLEQLQGIFKGEITNWQIISGIDTAITVLIRPPNSGTYLYFKEHILNDQPYTPSAYTRATTEAVVMGVLENTFAIGYGGTAYGPEVTHCKINGIEPTLENVKLDIYPLIRYLYLYTVDKPEGEVKQFIDWILSESGQAIVAKVGYIPLW